MKKGKSKPVSAKSKVTNIDVAIEDRLAGCGRKEHEHIIYVGELVERALKGEIGAVIKALTAGRSSNEIRSNMDGKLSPDRVLGRIEAYENLWNDLEQFVFDKDALMTPLRTEVEDRQYGSQTFEYAPN